MSPRIQADFSQISSSFDPLPDGDYECVVKEMTDEITKENKLPMVKVTLEVDDAKHPEAAGRQLFDNLVLQQKDGKPNKVGLGQLKAYAEATLGEEAANSPEGIETEPMVNSRVIAVVKLRSWEKKDGAGNVLESGTSNDIKKILPVG